MPIFVVVGLDRRPKERGARDAIRPEHRDYVLTNVQPIVAASAMLDDDRSQCGSLYLFEADTIEEVHDWLAKEPFASSGIYETLAVRELEGGALWKIGR